MNLPEYITECRVCKGEGEYRQRYCDVPFPIIGPCELCHEPGTFPLRGSGYVYKATSKPVPRSVAEQIKTMREREEKIV